MSALSSSVENEQKVDGVRALKRWVARSVLYVAQPLNQAVLMPLMTWCSRTLGNIGSLRAIKTAPSPHAHYIETSDSPINPWLMKAAIDLAAKEFSECGEIRQRDLNAAMESFRQESVMHPFYGLWAGLTAEGHPIEELLVRIFANVFEFGRTAERLLQSANAEKLQPVECAEESAKTK